MDPEMVASVRPVLEEFVVEKADNKQIESLVDHLHLCFVSIVISA